MNVNEYAERVLFSDDLDEKLRLTTGTVDFAFQQGKISRNTAPGRPDFFQFTDSENISRVPLPSRPSLVDDRSRGTLLHFFANHELLAAELMALALLKFPDAPIEFRRGLFETLQEEQKHTLWYLGRMKECGVSLGEFPVSRFFWDMVSSMETPFDYVSRLSLTFEQSNLDYARHYAGILEEVGDPRTSRIMEKIYEDEIEHVRYGLRWFREWKNPQASDWEAFQDQLTLPLSPSRAKGNGTPFNREGRIATGFDSEFVRNLAVYERSKGRTPDLFYFNPDAEDRIALRGKPYHPSPKVAALIRDLEIIQVFLARRDDVVLVEKLPPLDHLERLQEAGFQLPEFEVLDAERALPPDSHLLRRKINRFRPWSASPELPAKFMRLETNNESAAAWNPEWASFFSKTAQSEFFGELMGDGLRCTTIEEARHATEKLLDDQGAVIKIPVAAAGRGIRFFQDSDKALRQAETWLEAHGEILIERAHHRVFDFSVQFEIQPDKITKAGPVRQLIDAGGRYRGSISSPKFCKGLPGDLARFLMEDALPTYEEDGPLVKELRSWSNRFGYSGPLGIDAYIYRTPDQQLALRAICEINARYTMGRVTHEIRKAISPGYSVKFEIDKASPPLSGLEPIIDSRTNRIAGGSLCLNHIDETTRFAATIKVDKVPQNL